LVGERTGTMHRLGDRVVVRLIEAAPVAGALRFELLSEGRYNAARPRRITRERVARKDTAQRPRRRKTRKQ
jgi:ribonuclease R